MDLFVKVAYDDKDVDKGIEGTSKKGKGFAETLGSAFGGVAKVVGIVSGAAIAVGGAFVKGVMDVSDYGSEVNDMSQKLNMSAGGFQEWRYILGQSGVDIGVLQGGMKKLSESAVEGSEAFDTLGMSQEELASLSTEELFNKTIEQLSEMEAGNERTKLASDLFGRSATELLPILNEGADGIDAMRKQAEDYGLVMSDESVAASDAFGDSASLMEQTLNGMKNRMMGEFLPSLTLVTDGLAKLFTGDMSGLDSINQGINDFVNKIIEAMPKILEIGGSILGGLAESIIENLPLLVSTAFDILTGLAMYLIENMPMLLQSAIDIITSLAEGLAEQLPILIPAVMSMIEQLVLTLLEPENIEKLMNAAIDIMMGITTGLIGAIPDLVAAIPEILIALVAGLITQATTMLEAGPEIIDKIGQGITDAASEIKEKIKGFAEKNLLQPIKDAVSDFTSAGKKLVEGIWNGINDKFQWIKEKISGWVGKVTKALKGFFGIKSPSTVMRDEVGKYLSMGVGEGIMKYAGYATSAMASLMNGIMGETYNPVINPTVNGSTGLYGDALASAGGMGGVSIGQVNFNQPLQSTTQAAKLFGRKLVGELYA